ncbi:MULTISPECIES: hypothetical protein [Exiguobacterium]|uniref:Uncharacterized protein n=1 Tax=Exiguobacterium oxidotolerans TaxID=223958 RepID=A0A653I2Y0_9BACL|nr:MULTISPECIES: hypothetical protein [Exiguobacterium]ASI34589.1 hypothetical protein A0126_03040 [Exiguobacterium sp. N4-1P]VWX33305.1 conserved hypothetical protein [Exiguobacterium oxidotolerans]
MYFYLFTTLTGLISTYLSFITGYYTDSVGIFVFTLSICLSLSSFRQLIRTTYHGYHEYMQYRRVKKQLERMKKREHSYQLSYEQNDTVASLALSTTEQHDK